MLGQLPLLYFLPLRLPLPALPQYSRLWNDLILDDNLASAGACAG